MGNDFHAQLRIPSILFSYIIINYWYKNDNLYVFNISMEYKYDSIELARLNYEINKL
jgi:hypothetical protein